MHQHIDLLPWSVIDLERTGGGGGGGYFKRGVLVRCLCVGVCLRACGERVGGGRPAMGG